MGLFGNLFKEKNCEVCGKELGVFGKVKLSEGYLCKDCSGLLSPFFQGRRSATVEQIREQLAYREENKAKVAAFNVTTTLDGGNKKVYLDEEKGQLIISGSRSWRDENPDVIDFAQVTGCSMEIDEDKSEVYREDADGKRQSYVPPRYEYEYDFDVKVYFNHPYFSEVSWQVNTNSIDDKRSLDYQEANKRAEALRDKLSNLHQENRAAAAPKQAVTCPHCLASTIPDAQGRCEYCGGSVLQ